MSIKRYFKNRYTLGVLLLLVGASVASRQYWLPLLAAPVVHGASIGKVDAVAIDSGDRRYDFAAKAIADGNAEQILLFQGRERWVVKIGAIPPSHENARQQLIKRHVDVERISFLPGATKSLWDEADRLEDWLSQHPKSSAALLVSRFRSAEARTVLDRVLDGEVERRVLVVALPDRRFDERNWWKSRYGWRELFSAYVGLGYAAIVGRPGKTGDDWDPDVFEKQLREKQRGS